jgi:pimeloyl-ACP methyl ester carboxylesterase
LGAAQQGTAGVIHDLATQFRPTPFPLDAVRAPVHLVTGADDHTCPPAFVHWYAAELPSTTVEIVPGAGHAHLLTAWTEILRHAVEGR